MSSLSKLRKNIEKYKIKQKTGLEPKYKCPHCKKLTVFKVYEENKEKAVKCIRCGYYVDINKITKRLD